MKINTDEIRKHFSIYNCTCPVTIFVLCDEIDRLNAKGNRLRGSLRNPR